VRVLWLLPKAAPALLRHLAAYVELASLDIKKTQRQFAVTIVAFVAVVICLFFAVLMGCAAVVALTWNTPNRLPAIGWMAGGFLIIAIIALIYRSSTVRDQERFLASVRAEWQEDRVLLERILSDEDR
jgi:uncharacterized membrane protein YqjE